MPFVISSLIIISPNLLTDQPHSGGNVLDLVLSTDLKIIDNLLVFQTCDSLRSDHFMISFELLLPSTPSHSHQLPHGNDTLVLISLKLIP